MQKIEFEQRAGLKKELSESDWNAIETVYMQFNFEDVPDFINTFWKNYGMDGVRALFTQCAYVGNIKAQAKTDFERGSKLNDKVYDLEGQIFELKRIIKVYRDLVPKEKLIEALDMDELALMIARKQEVA